MSGAVRGASDRLCSRIVGLQDDDSELSLTTVVEQCEVVEAGEAGRPWGVKSAKDPKNVDIMAVV